MKRPYMPLRSMKLFFSDIIESPNLYWSRLLTTIRYADQKVSDDHLASEPVQALISLFGSSPAILSEAPKVYQLEYTGPKHHFTRSEAKSAQDAFIVFATAQQQEVSQTSSLTATWAAVVAKAEADESGTLMYGLVRNKEDPIEIGTIEAYVDEKGFEEHCKSGEVGTLVEENTEIGGKMSYVSLKLVTGWLSR